MCNGYTNFQPTQFFALISFLFLRLPRDTAARGGNKNFFFRIFSAAGAGGGGAEAAAAAAFCSCSSSVLHSIRPAGLPLLCVCAGVFFPYF